MSVLNPVSVQDHFDRKKTLSNFRQMAIGDGLDDSDFESYYTAQEAKSDAAISTALGKVDPAMQPVVVMAEDGQLYVPRTVDRVESYAPVTPVMAAVIGLDGSINGQLPTPRPIPPAPVDNSTNTNDLSGADTATDAGTQTATDAGPATDAGTQTIPPATDMGGTPPTDAGGNPLIPSA